MRAIKITLILVFVLVLGYCGAAVVIAMGANAKQAELEANLVRLTGFGQSQVAELGGITDAMQPVVAACKDLPKVDAEEVVLYLGPPPPGEPAEPGQSLTTRFDHLSGSRAGNLAVSLAQVQPQLVGLGDRFVSVLTEVPWAWDRFTQGLARNDYPPVERARYLLVARPTLLMRPKLTAEGAFNGGMVVMQVAVLDAATGELKCRGGLADQAPKGIDLGARDGSDQAASQRGEILRSAYSQVVEILALHHLCALGGPELCQLTNRRMDAGR